MVCYRFRTLALAFAAVGILVGSNPAVASVTYSNADVSLQVNGGEANNGTVPANGYFNYELINVGVETTWSIDPLLILPTGQVINLANGLAGGFGSPVDNGGVAQSTAVISNELTVEANTTLNNLLASTTFNFITDGSLEGYKLVFYAENDIPPSDSNIAGTFGSLAGGDLILLQANFIPGGIVVGLLGGGLSNAQLSLYGSGLWTGFGTALESADLSVLSSDGSNFVYGPGDLGLALGFDLSGTGGASLVVNYVAISVPVPEVGTFAYLAVAIGAFGGYRIFKRRSL